MGTTGLTFHVPVGLFLRRIFNVASSLTVSNYYFLYRKKGDEREKEVDACMRSRETARGILHTVEEPRSQENDAKALGAAVSSHLNTQAPRQPKPNKTEPERPPSVIQKLMTNPTLFNPIRKPRNPIILCHGLYGYDVMGPSSFPWLQVHYWLNTLNILKKKIGADVIVTAVPGTGSIESRAKAMDVFLREKARGKAVNLLAHSMGGLDCRQLITHVKPSEYKPASLTTVCTPHRGSPFMDWCAENIGIGKLQQQAKEAGKSLADNDVPKNTPLSASLASIPTSLMTLLLTAFDSPAYANLTTHFLRDVFNPSTPNDPNVSYYSIAARTSHMSIWHPLWIPKTVVDGVEAKERDNHPNPDTEDWGNDGLVSVRSARWGEFLGTLEGCDHWDARGSSGVGGDTEWNIDLMLPSKLKNSLSDPFSSVNVNFSWKDWGRLVGAWRKEEEQREERERESSGKGEDKVSRRKKDEDRDAVLKSSTDKVSAVFDWVAEQASSSSQSASTESPHNARSKEANATDKSTSMKQNHEIDVEKAKEGDSKDNKFDLERFYVALTRKLYEDGF